MTRRPAPTSPRVGPPPPPLDAGRARFALFAALAVTCGLHGVATFATGSAFWGLDASRYLGIVWGWAPWALVAVALAPPVGAWSAPPLERIGDALVARRWAGALGCGLATAGMVVLAPDAVRSVGDFLLRQGGVEQSLAPEQVSPQSLPLDSWLHYDALQLFGPLLGGTNAAARLLGAAQAFVYGAGAVVFARSLSLRGVAALIAIVAALATGALGLFTGYAKAFTGLVMLAPWAVAAAARTPRDSRALAVLGGITAIAVSLHRSGLGYLVLPAIALARLARSDGASALRRPGAVACALFPLAAVALVARQVVDTAGSYDATRHFAGLAVPAGLRALDLANVALLLAPLVLAGLAVWAIAPSRGRDAALASPAALAAVFVTLALLLTPQQGVPRDWDVFAPAGAALALLIAALLGRAFLAAPTLAPLALAVMLSALAPAAQWLRVHADADAGLARVEAIVVGPPLRPDAERAQTWDFLGVRHYRRERWQESTRAFRQAVEFAPSPRLLSQWAMAATYAESLGVAQHAWQRAVERDSNQAIAWNGLAAVSSRLEDWPETGRALRQMLRFSPGDTLLPTLIRRADSLEKVLGQAQLGR